jgi:hypothetical protein
MKGCQDVRFSLGPGTLFKVCKLPSPPLLPYWHCEFSQWGTLIIFTFDSLYLSPPGSQRHQNRNLLSRR